jgi:hypothetical protein
MDVFIVTHSPRIDENNERVVTTDVWRIFSEAKGSALFHNKGLDDIVKYYRERLGLKRAYVFSDGCRSQYAPPTPSTYPPQNRARLYTPTCTILRRTVHNSTRLHITQCAILHPHVHNSTPHGHGA